MNPARALAACAALVACSAEPPPYAPPPEREVIEEAPARIRREVFLVPGATPAPHPQAGPTPARYNQVRVVRYRLDSDPPRPARAIAVLMPGFLGGAGSYDPMARALVRRSTADAAIEAWAIDRRSNLLEDHHGLDVAEVRRDPELARRYYFYNEEIEGRRFAGFVPPQEVAFASEWGLRTTVEDLRAVISLVPQAERRARVVLVGHSMGASMSEAYAAWDFGGTPGYSELAGLVLVDGVAGAEGQAAPSISAREYEEGGGGGGLFQNPGLAAIRKGAPYFTLPLLGTTIYPVTAIVAMRALWSPREIVEDIDRDQALGVLLGLRELPKLTNRAALGFAFDQASNGLTFAAVSCGQGVGGPLTEYASILGARLVHPSDPAATYDWVEYDKVQPPGHTSLDDLARSWYQGPGLDFAEWYFPTRLALDIAAAATLTLKDEDWPLRDHGLLARHGRDMDLPVLAIATALVGGGKGETRAFERLRQLVAATPIGPGRPLAGTTRESQDAFAAVGYPGMTHIDPLSGADGATGPARPLYDALAAWLVRHTPAGGVQVAR
jgi:hypothetical protein